MTCPLVGADGLLPCLFGPAARPVLETALTALQGLATGLVLAVASQLLRRLWRRFDVLSRPLLFLGYALPPFAVAQIGVVLGGRDELAWILVGVAVAMPLALHLVVAVGQAAALRRTVVVGSRTRAAWFVDMPTAAPPLLSGLATCWPWAFLAALLAELAVGTPGLGPAVFHAIQRGPSAALPYLTAAACLSVIPFVVLALASYGARRLLRLEHVSVETYRPHEVQGGSLLTETGVLLAVVALGWLLLNQRAPILVPSLDRTATALAGMGRLPLAVAETVGTTAAAMVTGTLFGLACALLGHLSPAIRPVVAGLLLPLQVLPLIVFAPWLMALQRAVETWMRGGLPPARFGEPDVVSALLPSLMVALLAAAYVSFQAGSAQLDALPRGLGPMLAARPRTDSRALRYVYLPWLMRAAPRAVEVALPRVLLAVLVCEYLVTASGLGGMLFDQRGQREFAETWITLLVVIGSIVLLTIAASLTMRGRG